MFCECMAGLLACECSLYYHLPGFTQWHADKQLFAYSCGGSHGLTVFPINAVMATNTAASLAEKKQVMKYLYGL